MKKSLMILVLSLLSGLLAACADQNKSTVDIGKEINIYYLNKENTKVVAEGYYLENTITEEALEEVLDLLSSQPENVELKAPIGSDFKVLEYYVKEANAVVNVEGGYQEMDPIREVLTRAALVRTLTQVPGIDYVSLKIAGEPLTDTIGNLVGTMSADMFIDNAGKEINAYEKARLHLYFANKEGDSLVEISKTVVYNSNISLEKLVVEQIITGPKGGEAYPTINPNTKLISVTVKDGVCYVNLDETFLTQIYNVSSDVTIYSLANSLVELSNVNKVQISINGDSNITYREKTSLTKFFERNLDLVK